MATFPIALFLRLWGIGYAPGTPLARPDEQVFITRAIEAFGSSGMKSGAILYGGFPEGYFWILHFMQWVQARVLDLMWHKPVNLGCLYALNPGALEIPARVLSTACDLLSMVVVGAVVRRLCTRLAEARNLPILAPWPFVLGALAFGCNYLVVRDAHFAATDSLLVLCVCVFLYGGVRAVTEDPLFLILAAGAAGAGFGFKYAALFLIASCAVAGGACLYRGRARPLRVLFIGLLAVLTAGACFAVLSPGVFSHPSDFVTGVMGHRADRYGARARMFLLDKRWEVPSGWTFYLLDVLPTSFGWPGYLLALFGFAVAIASDVGAGLVVFSTAAAAIAMVASAKALFVRYAAPAVPPLAVGVALALCASFALAARWPRLKYLLGLLLVVAAVAPPVWQSVQFDRLMASPDTRELARKWLSGQGPGITARAEGWFAQTYLLDQDSAAACAAEIPPWLNLGIPVMASNGGSRWPAAIAQGEHGWGTIANDSGEAYLYRAPPAAQSDFLVDGYGTLPCGKNARTELRPFDPQCFELVDAIHPGGLACDAYVDMFDAFWLPFRGFAGQSLPGPEIRIFRNRCKNP